MEDNNNNNEKQNKRRLGSGSANPMRQTFFVSQLFNKDDAGLNLKQHLRGSRKENGKLRELILQNIFDTSNRDSEEKSSTTIYNALNKLQQNIAHWHKCIMKYLRRKDAWNIELHNVIGSDGLLKDAQHLNMKSKKKLPIPSQTGIISPKQALRSLRSMRSFEFKDDPKILHLQKRLESRMNIHLSGKNIIPEDDVNKLKINSKLALYVYAILQYYQRNGSQMNFLLLFLNPFNCGHTITFSNFCLYPKLYEFFIMIIYNSSFGNNPEKLKLAWIYTNQAIKISDSLEEAMVPNIISKRIRTMMFYGKFMMELKMHEKAITVYYKTLEMILLQLSLVSNKDLPKKDDVKDGIIWINSIRLYAVTYFNMSKCYEELNYFQKALECSKAAAWIIFNFTSGEDQISITIKNHYDTQVAKYSEYLRELSEIERAIFDLYYQKFHTDLIETEEFPQEEYLDNFNDAMELLNKEINYDELLLKSSLNYKMGQENSTQTKRKRISIESVESGVHSTNQKKIFYNEETLKTSQSAKNLTLSNIQTTDHKSGRLTTATTNLTFNEEYVPKALTTRKYFKTFEKTVEEEKPEKNKLKKNFSNFLQPNKAKKLANKRSSSVKRTKFIHQQIDKKGNLTSEKVDIDSHFKKIIQEKFEQSELNDRQITLKTIEELKGDSLFEFKKEEFDKKEFKFSKGLIQQKKKEDFASKVDFQYNTRQELKFELDYYLTKNKIEQGVERLKTHPQFASEHNIKKENEYDINKSKKARLVDIIFNHADVFKLKNIIIKKKKMTKTEVAVPERDEESPQTADKKLSVQELRQLRKERVQFLKDKILNEMNELEKNGEQIEKKSMNLQKKKKSQLSSQFSEFNLIRQNNNLSKTTKNYGLMTQGMKELNFYGLVVISKKLKKNAIK